MPVMLLPNERKAVDKLLDMYATYKALSTQLEVIDRQLAKAKLKGQPTDNLKQERAVVKEQLQVVSDKMTFATPLLWAAYKFEAYASEAQPITTMQDFRTHCSKPGYICTKRYSYINKMLVRQNLPALSNDVVYPNTTPVSKTFSVLRTLQNDDIFMNQWRKHEYFKRGDTAAKWENYSTDSV